MKKFISLVLALVMALSLTTVAWGADVAEYNGTNYATLQDAIDDAEATGGTITLLADCGEDVVVEQAPNVAIVINGANKTYTGTITVDGKSAAYPTAALKTQNVNFDATSITKDAYINLGKGGDNNTRYTNNVTVKDCTFSYSGSGDVVAIKSYTGGDKNLTVEGCIVNSGMHSLLQVKNVETGVKIIGCKVYSKEGVNLNSTPALEMSGCEFDVQGYAVRVGVNGTVNTTEKSFTITDSTLKSACADGDAVIVFRDDAKKADVTITDTTLTGPTTFAGNDDVTDIFVDGAMVDGVAEVNGTQYKSLQAAVDNAAGGTVKLLDNVTLTSSINVTDALTIDGNNKTIKMTYTGTPGTGNAFFNENGGNEGIANSLTVKNLKMVMTGATKQGYAVVAKKADSAFAISFTDCHFENMYCAVMLNGCGGTVAPTVTITDSSFKDVNYGLSFAEEAYAGDVSFEDNTMTGEISIQETFPAGSGYLATPTVEISSGSFSSNVEDYLTAGLFQNANGSVASLPTSVIPSGGATLAPDFNVRGEAQYASWNAKVSVKKAENAKDKEFTIYTIEMIAKVDNAPIWWDSGVADDKGDKEKFEFNGEREFVKVSAELAQFVIVDGKTITYFACADDINEDGWDEKVSAVTLPLIPNAQADWRCNAYYITDVADLATSFFWYEGDLYAPAATYTHVFNVAGVAVGAAEVVPFDTYFSASTAADRVVFVNHNYVVEYKGNGYGAENVSKVYCDVCKKSFDFAVGNELAAVAKFGEGKYFVLDTGLFVEKDTTPGTVRPSGSSSSGTSTDKVESAETFDAGIAMYVGMSVMAAAGSAVVLKKKD